VAGSCEYGDEPAGSGATELVSSLVRKYITCFMKHHRRTKINRLQMWVLVMVRG
jgi:hypothetical protein